MDFLKDILGEELYKQVAEKLEALKNACTSCDDVRTIRIHQQLM